MSNGQEDAHFKYTLDCCLEEGRDSVAEVYITGCVGGFHQQTRADGRVCLQHFRALCLEGTFPFCQMLAAPLGSNGRNASGSAGASFNDTYGDLWIHVHCNIEQIRHKRQSLIPHA